MRLKIAILSASFAILSAVTAFAQNSKPRNLILFVPDGLRGRIVTPETAPAMALGLGPMKTIPVSASARGKASRSDRNP